MNNIKKIPKWVYAILIVLLILILSITTQNDHKLDSITSENDKDIANDDVENNEKETLDNFPIIKEKMDSIISELEKSEWFTFVEFYFISNEENYSNDGSITVSYKVSSNDHAMVSFFFRNNDIDFINYSNVGSSETATQIYNRRLTLTKLSIVNISENSFDNSDDTHNYETFQHLTDGSNCDTYVITKDNKTIMCTAHSYSIYFH